MSNARTLDCKKKTSTSPNRRERPLIRKTGWGTTEKDLFIYLLCHIYPGVPVEAVTTDSWCDSWCLLCVETVGANTSWPVSVNIL